jgi:hypothetical protein
VTKGQTEQADDAPLFVSGAPCLTVSTENYLNRNLFIGRTIHFTLQFIEPLLAQFNAVHLSPQLDASMRAFASFASVPSTRTSARDFDTAAGLVGLWYQVEMLLLGRDHGDQWATEAAATLAHFLRIESDESDEEFPHGGGFAGELARCDHHGFLQWIDGSGSGGPSAELMCYMNPYWRRVGFIYGSPFDTVLSLKRVHIAAPYSQIAALRDRHLYPPISTSLSARDDVGN